MRSRDVGQHGIADLLAIRGEENGPDRQWGVEYRLLLYVGKWASLMNSPFYSFPNDLEDKSTIESTSKNLQVAPQNVPQNGHLDSTRIGTANGAIALVWPAAFQHLTNSPGSWSLSKCVPYVPTLRTRGLVWFFMVQSCLRSLHNFDSRSADHTQGSKHVNG